MAVEKSKVVARYKSLFGSVGLSATRLDAIAAKLASKIADESDDDVIDAELNNLNDVYSFSDIKKNDDRTANDKHNQQRKKDEEVEPEDTTEIGKLRKMVSGLTETVTALKESKQQESIAQRFAGDPRLKGIPEMMLKGRTPKTDEEFDAKVDELAQDYKAFAEKNKLDILGDDIPLSGDATGAKGKVKEISAEEAAKLI